MKCKNCIHLMDCVDIGTNGEDEYKWCPVKNDSPDIESERDCDEFECMTNADRIRSMTDEELANFIAYGISWREICKVCGYNCENNETDKCASGALKWLQMEIE